MSEIGFDRTSVVHVHQERITRGSGASRNGKNRNQKKIWYWIGGGAALLLMFSAGYVIGLKNGEIHVDGRDISVSKSGIIHNSSCTYFKKNCAQNCQFCGGLKTK